jgi:tryptophan synthase alpha chain
MAERIQRMLAGRDGKALVIPYLTAGYPDPGETVDLLLALEQGGADAIELGLPFSDPLADGPVIQATSQRALDAGIDHAQILAIAEAFRKQSQVPLVVMGYLNPILAYGAERFFVDAVAAGVDGIIVPDLPPEEASPFHEPAVAAGLSWIFLAAPTSSDERLSRIDALSVDMSYCVAVTGVTGARQELAPDLTEYLDRARRKMEKPFVVGFGISSRTQIERVVPPAAGVVVGSALLRALADETDAPGRRRRAEQFLKGLRTG